MKNKLFTLLVSACLAGVVTSASAENADRSKPMNVESDTLRYDDLKQVSIFSGRVVLTKGTIVIRGAQIEVHQDADGYQYGLVTGSPDKRAFFRQKREALDEFIEGEGETIYYDGKLDTVTFTKRAQLRRYRGTKLGDEVTGGLIVYENLTDMFSVDGNVNKGPSGATTGGRVRAMLTPKADPAAGAVK
jgi:lipopolysaccharide export system protein LptA